MDLTNFYSGKCFDAYEWMGAHVGPDGVTFRTYAPNAKWVNLLFDGQEITMKKALDGKFYEITLPQAKPGDVYEYRVHRNPDDSFVDHCDPYGFGMQLRPDHKSVIRDRNSYTFHDEEWLSQRSDCVDRPLNIYEMHAGSWRKPGGMNPDGTFADEPDKSDVWYNYSELAAPLIQYLKESGYNYVEFMPLSEHPADNSWGYQNTGFFSPTSRYGTMEQLKYLIDQLHQNNIGAIIDYVPVHFAVDVYGLKEYDGTPLYEYPHKDIAVSEWGSYNFQHSKGEVASFLQSAANFWIKELHFDGLRMDAISRVIYWQGDQNRGENKAALDWLRNMNQGLKELNPGIMLIAEDSTDYAKVTKPVAEGGLGFDYKWDMGWMHDTLEYLQMAALGRKPNYHKLTFSMMYFWNEHFLLPLSHDEVVHGKATILQKMNGDYTEKFPQARLLYMYMMMHPGKTLNFMGNEFGQLREWDEKKNQDWFMMKYPNHDAFYHYMKELNHLYLDHPAFWQKDYEFAGFDWLDCNQTDRLIYVMQRKSDKEEYIAVFNFDNVEQNGYTLAMGDTIEIERVLNTDWQRFGGSTPDDDINKIRVLGDTLICDLPKFSGVIIRITKRTPKKRPRTLMGGKRITPKKTSTATTTEEKPKKRTSRKKKDQ